MDIQAAERSALIRLASTLPQGSEERLAVLHTLKTARTYREYLEEKESRGEEPLSEEEWNSRGEDDEGGGGGGGGPGPDPGGEAEGTLQKWVSKAKGLSNKGKETLSKLSDDAKRLATDPQARNEAMANAATKIKEKAKETAQKIVDDYKEDIKSSAGGIKKLMKGELPSKEEAKAMGSLALDVTQAVLAVGTAGAAGGASFFGTSLAKKVALSCVNPMLGKLDMLNEIGGTGEALLGLLKFGKDEKTKKRKGEVSDDEAGLAFVHLIMGAVLKKMEEGIPNDELVKMLNDEPMDLALGAIKTSEEGKQARRKERPMSLKKILASEGLVKVAAFQFKLVEDGVVEIGSTGWGIRRSAFPPFKVQLVKMDYRAGGDWGVWDDASSEDAFLEGPMARFYKEHFGPQDGRERFEQDLPELERALRRVPARGR